MAYKDYQDVARQPLHRRRELLVAGDSPERVWAAWSLALDTGRRAAPWIVDSLKRWPEGGVRRHLVVVLAGLGERGVVRTLAAFDPDDQVRATAWQHFLGTAPSFDPTLAGFVDARLLADPSPAVRERILRSLRPGLGGVTLNRLASLAADAQEAVRRAALAQIELRHPADEFFPQPLGPRLVDEPAADLKARLAVLCLRSGRRQLVLEAAARSPIGDAEVLLEVLADLGERFAWEELAELAARGRAALDWRLVDLLSPTAGDEVTVWLAQGIARRLRLPRLHPADDEFLQRAQPRLFTALESAEALPAAPELRPDLRTILEFLESDAPWEYETEASWLRPLSAAEEEWEKTVSERHAEQCRLLRRLLQIDESRTVCPSA
jgi:hypothetical protein